MYSMHIRWGNRLVVRWQWWALSPRCAVDTKLKSEWWKETRHVWGDATTTSCKHIHVTRHVSVGKGKVWPITTYGESLSFTRRQAVPEHSRSPPLEGCEEASSCTRMFALVPVLHGSRYVPWTSRDSLQ